MPSLNGGTNEEIYELFLEHAVSETQFDTESEALEYCVRFTLNRKYNADV